MISSGWIRQVSTAYQQVFIAVLAVLAFGACLWNGFVADDYFILLPVQSYWDFDLKTILFTRANSLEYLPVRDFSLAMDAALWGKTPLGFHLTNLLLYLITLPLVFHVASMLSRRLGSGRPGFIAFWATLIFALHPLQAEAINFISARNNILAMLFLMLSLAFFLSGYGVSRLRIALSLFAFLLALFSKVSAIFYPLFLIAMVVFVPALRGQWRTALMSIAPFVLVDVAALWVHLSNASDTGVIHDELIRFGGDSLLLTVARAMVIPYFYFKQMLIPYPLTILYPDILLTGNVMLYAVLACSGLVLILVLAWRYGRTSWLPFAGLVWLLLSLGPVMNIFPTVPVVADRYTYLGMFGFALVLACLLAQVKNRQLVFVLGGCMALVWVGLDIKRSFEWRSDLSLYESAYAAYPDVARFTYAKALFHDGMREEALALYDGLAVPGYEYHYLRGRALAKNGQYEQAVSALQQALREGGGAEATVYLALAETFESGGDKQQALHAYLRVLEATRQDLFGVYHRQAESAIRRLRQDASAKRTALMEQAASRPQDLKAQYELAVFLHTMGEYEEAARYYRKAGEISPTLWEPWYNLGIVYLKLEAYGDAVDALQQSLKRRKDADGKTLHFLGVASEGLGDDQAAIGYYRRALEADPSMLQSALQLGQIFYRLGDRREALSYYRQAESMVGDDQAMKAQIQQMMEALQ